MAKIVGAVTTSHVPAIGGAIHKGLQEEPYWKPFFDGFPPIREWLDKVKPDVAIVVSNDHGLNFFLDKMPTFAIGTAPQYQNADEGWGIPVVPPFQGDEDLSWHLAESLIGDEFDMVTCQEMKVDHAFTQAIGRAVEAYDEDVKVLLIGTGGLSHQLEGERAGHINKPFDLKFMESMTDDPTWATQYSDRELVEHTGTQGIELLNWLVVRGAMSGEVSVAHSNYHIPISNTAAATMLMEHHG
ncbi:MAG: protocatechuate 3,4-dioxygenase [Candidatus Thiodiazotropha sp.]